MKKSKEKIRERRSNAKSRNKEMLEDEMSASEDETESHIRIKHIEYKPMDVEEAALQLDLLDDNFLVFTNARSDQVNVLYRRKDGHYGLIQPSNWPHNG